MSADTPGHMPEEPPRDPASAADPLFDGPGEMRALCRAFDWSSTPLGPSPGWPVSLRTIVGTLLGSRNPMVLFWGPELIQIYNDAFRPSLGGSGSEHSRHPRALGMRGREFWTDVWDEVGPQIDQVMTSGEATWREDHYLPIERNGRLDDVWWTYSYGPTYDDDGRIHGVLVVCQETTQRVLAETALVVDRKRLEEVFRSAPTFLAVLRGEEHVFELVNDAYYSVVGHRDLIGRPLAEALPEVAHQGFAALLDRVLQTGEPYVGREVAVELIRSPGGEPEQRFVDFVYLPLRESGDDRPSGIIAHGHDVTEQVQSRREAERLLAASEQARADAEAANRVKAQFLTVMSHELRTPLNAIGGYTELLKLGVRGTLNDEQLDFLDRIQQSQVHLLGLINEVLNFAKLETGTVQYDIAEVSVGAALASAVALVEPQARARGLRLVSAPCPESLRIRTDPEKFRQILLNLLSNAVKFTQSGGRIEISAAAGDGVVRIDVRDTGIGIPEDRLEDIFDPFVQVRSDLTRPYEGTGLGLAISRDLARGMSGDLVVDSEPGAGSTFTLTLPLA